MPTNLRVMPMCIRYATNEGDDGDQDGHGGVTLFLDIGNTVDEIGKEERKGAK